MELAATKLNTPTSDLDEIACEYLTFALGKEEYAIDILKVQEIRGYETVTNIANAPSFIKGVINLRGKVNILFVIASYFVRKLLFLCIILEIKQS